MTFSVSQTTFQPAHSTLDPRQVTRFRLDNPSADIADYVDRSRALEELLRQLDPNQPFAVLGSGWSGALWEPRPGPPVEERFLFTNGWPTGFRVPTSRVARSFSGNRQGVFWAEGGLPLSHLNQALLARGLSLGTFGSNNGQTVAGAISTGAHGAGFDFGSIHDAVVGLHIKYGPEPDQDVYIEPRPIVSKTFAKSRMKVGRVLRDAELFRAALVGLGCFGVIRGVVLDTEPVFDFERFSVWRAYNDTFRAALSTLDFAGLPVPRALKRIDEYVGPDKPAGNFAGLIAGRELHHIEVVLNPNGPPANNLQLILMVKDPQREVNPVLKQPLPTLLNFHSSVLSFFAQLMVSGALPGPISQALLNSEIKDRYGEGWMRAPIRFLFRDEPFKAAAVSSGISIDPSRAVEALNLVFDYYKNEYLARNRALPIVISQRFVKRGGALMGYTRHGADPAAGHPFPDTTCILEIDGVGSDPVQQFLDESLCLLVDNGIDFSLHWGKNLSYFTLSDADYQARCMASVGHAVPRNTVAHIYGADLVRWRTQRDNLLTPIAQQLFNNPVLQQIGVVA